LLYFRRKSKGWWAGLKEIVSDSNISNGDRAISVIGSNNQGGSPLQVHDGKRLVSEPKSVATKFNKLFAAIGSKVAGRLNPVSKDA